MEHLYTYLLFLGLTLSQWACTKLAERHAEKIKGLMPVVHGVHFSMFGTLIIHPVTIDTVHEWLVHALIYSH